jgi:hypothetical protein
MAIDQEKAVSVVPGAVEVVGSAGTAEGRGDHYGLSFTGDPIAVIQARPRQLRARVPSQGRQDRRSTLPAPKVRLALRVNWKAAREAADAMVQAGASKDMAGLAIAADDLDQALAKLWELRSVRDLDWQTILNHVQGMMRQFFARKQVEELTQEQCRRILTIVEDYLGPATKSVADLNEVLRLIEDAGFDPYGAISGDSLESGPVN